MPFEQKYSDETREKSLARVLERREAEPGNRAIIRETAAEFEVGEQSLRGWIRAHERSIAPAPTPDDAVERELDVTSDDDDAVAPASTATPRRGRPPGSGSAATAERVAELEAEVAKLRRDREALKSAMAVLLAD
jgi:transposase-like protein